MNANLIRISILTGFALASAGAIAHTDYSEGGSWHWLEHVAEAKSQPRGVLGPVRNDPEPTASPRTPQNGKPEHPALPPFRGLGGIGGDKHRADGFPDGARQGPVPVALFPVRRPGWDRRQGHQS